MTADTPAMRLPSHRTHAYLLTVKGAAAARAAYTQLASALLCTAPDADGSPCGVCDACRKTERGVHPDIRLYDADKTTVDDIRALRDDTALPPVEGQKKIYVITHADMLDPRQQNAILKTLEEPPKYVAVIMTAASKSGILPTVLSRVSVLAADISGTDQYRAAAEAMLKGKDGDAEALAAYLEAYGLTDPSEVSPNDVMGAMALAARYYYEKDVRAVCDFPHGKDDRTRMMTYCRVFMLAARNIMLYKLTNGRLPEHTDEAFRKGCVRFSVKRAISCCELFERVYTDAERSGNVGVLYTYLITHA